MSVPDAENWSCVLEVMMGPLKGWLRRSFGFVFEWVARCPGMVKIISLRIVQIDIPLLNLITWRWMYLRKALDYHCPMRIIM